MTVRAILLPLVALLASCDAPSAIDEAFRPPATELVTVSTVVTGRSWVATTKVFTISVSSCIKEYRPSFRAPPNAKNIRISKTGVFSSAVVYDLEQEVKLFSASSRGVSDEVQWATTRELAPGEYVKKTCVYTVSTTLGDVIVDEERWRQCVIGTMVEVVRDGVGRVGGLRVVGGQ